MTCRCGAPLHPSATFCVECGAPGPVAGPPPWGYPPPRPARSWAPWIAGLASVLVLALAAVVVVLVLRPTTTVAAPGPISYLPSSPYGGYPGYAAPSSRPAPTTTRPSPASTGAPTSSSFASDELDSYLASDSSSVEALDGDWVAQLSSKPSGGSADVTALGDHLTLRGEYSPVRLLRSGDWNTFGTSGYWVTVVAEPFSSAAVANAWCDDHGRSADDCFAKYLSHTAGPDGATVHR